MSSQWNRISTHSMMKGRVESRIAHDGSSALLTLHVSPNTKRRMVEFDVDFNDVPLTAKVIKTKKNYRK